MKRESTTTESGKPIARVVTWVCDRCKTEADGAHGKPSSWASFRYQRPTAFDHQGCPWGAIDVSADLCGPCADAVAAVLNSGGSDAR